MTKAQIAQKLIFTNSRCVGIQESTAGGGRCPSTCPFKDDDGYECSSLRRTDLENKKFLNQIILREYLELVDEK